MGMQKANWLEGESAFVQCAFVHMLFILLLPVKIEDIWNTSYVPPQAMWSKF